MISKTKQPTLINYPSNNSPYDVKFTKCGKRENSFSFESYGLFLSSPIVLFPWKRGFAIGKQWYSIGNSGTGDPSMLQHEQMIFGEEIHTLITFMVSVMASNTVDGL